MQANPKQVISVLNDKDRFGAVRKVFGVMPFYVKLSTQDTEGTSLMVEQSNDYKGGPPRHIHHHQEELFYVVSGKYRVEIAGINYELGSGDSVFAPRGLPHSWALTGSGSGKMLIAFYPAGKMEAFFDKACQLENLPPHQELRQLFIDHDMEITGPPLELS